MTNKEKLNVLNIFLDKLNKNNMTCRQDIISLEEMLGNNIFTGSKDIVYLSPTSSCIGVPEVRNLVEKEIENVKSQSYITYTDYIHSVNDIITNLNILKEQLKTIKSIRFDVIELLQNASWRQCYLDQYGCSDIPDTLGDLKSVGFFIFLDNFQDHVRELCNLNQEDGEKIFTELNSLVNSIINNEIGVSFDTVVLNIFDVLDNYTQDNREWFDISNIPVNVLTVEHFTKIYGTCAKMEDSINLIINDLKASSSHEVMPVKDQELFEKEMNFINNINGMLANEKLDAFLKVVDVLKKI